MRLIEATFCAGGGRLLWEMSAGALRLQRVSWAVRLLRDIQQLLMTEGALPRRWKVNLLAGALTVQGKKGNSWF